MVTSRKSWLTDRSFYLKTTFLKWASDQTDLKLIAVISPDIPERREREGEVVVAGVCRRWEGPRVPVSRSSHLPSPGQAGQSPSLGKLTSRDWDITLLDGSRSDSPLKQEREMRMKGTLKLSRIKQFWKRSTRREMKGLTNVVTNVLPSIEAILCNNQQTIIGSKNISAGATIMILIWGGMLVFVIIMFIKSWLFRTKYSSTDDPDKLR